MRHLLGIVLAAAAAAAIYFAAGWGAGRIILATQTFTGGGRELAGVAVLAATGVLLGILAVLRSISPLAAGLPGIALLAWSVLYALDPTRAFNLIPAPHSEFGGAFSTLLGYGVTALLGAALIIPLFIPSRWRGAYSNDYVGTPTGIGLMR